MWRTLNREGLKKYYEEWIRGIATKVATKESIISHIQKHVGELEKLEDPERWAASMRNLMEVFEIIYQVNPPLELRVKKLEDYHNKNKKSCSPPISYQTKQETP